MNYATTKRSRNIHWGVPIQWIRRLKVYNVPKTTPSTPSPHPPLSPPSSSSSSSSSSKKKTFLREPVKTWGTSLYRISFVDTSNRSIILKQKLMNIMAESENKKFSVFKIKSSIETKNDSLCYLKGRFWVGNWCQHIRHWHWKDCNYLHVCLLSSVGLIWLSPNQVELSLQFLTSSFYCQK